MLNNHHRVGQHLWKDLEADFAVCFSRLSDGLNDRVGEAGEHKRLVVQMCERTLFKILGTLLVEDSK